MSRAIQATNNTRVTVLQNFVTPLGHSSCDRLAPVLVEVVTRQGDGPRQTGFLQTTYPFCTKHRNRKSDQTQFIVFGLTERLSSNLYAYVAQIRFVSSVGTGNNELILLFFGGLTKIDWTFMLA